MHVRPQWPQHPRNRQVFQGRTPGRLCRRRISGANRGASGTDILMVMRRRDRSPPFFPPRGWCHERVFRDGDGNPERDRSRRPAGRRRVAGRWRGRLEGGAVPRAAARGGDRRLQGCGADHVRPRGLRGRDALAGSRRGERTLDHAWRPAALGPLDVARGRARGPRRGHDPLDRAAGPLPREPGLRRAGDRARQPRAAQ